MRWRCALAEAAGIPLMLMDGYFATDGACFGALVDHIQRDSLGVAKSQWEHEVARWLPIKWESLRPDPLHILLNHSDCDCRIAAADCGPIADSLERLLPRLDARDEGPYLSDRKKAEQFIRGLRAAVSAGEAVKFH